MTAIVQLEFRESLLSIRDEILQSLGHPVISALGSRAARNLDLSHEPVGVVLIGHGAPWKERCNLAAHFRETLPGSSHSGVSLSAGQGCDRSRLQFTGR